MRSFFPMAIALSLVAFRADAQLMDSLLAADEICFSYKDENPVEDGIHTWHTCGSDADYASLTFTPIPLDAPPAGSWITRVWWQTHTGSLPSHDLGGGIVNMSLSRGDGSLPSVLAVAMFNQRAGMGPSFPVLVRPGDQLYLSLGCQRMSGYPTLVFSLDWGWCHAEIP